MSQVVLAARCPALASVIAADPARKDFYINEMDSNTLAEFLHFLYTDTTRQGIDVGTCERSSLPVTVSLSC
jgi:hypothetical protein